MLVLGLRCVDSVDIAKDGLPIVGIITVIVGSVLHTFDTRSGFLIKPRLIGYDE